MDVLALSSAGLLEAAPDAIVGVGVDGRIALVNAHVERLFGYQRRELLGQPVEMLVPLSGRAAHQLLREGYFHDLAPRSMGAGEQLAGRRKNGTEFPADISLSALHTGTGVMVFAAVRDVTERIEAQAERDRLKELAERERYEARLQQSERLESLGQLAGGIAHDFNNLLAVILNYSAFVAEEITAAAAQDGEDRWRDTLQDIAQIRRAGDRAAELTHQLLTFGRRDVVRPQVLDLNAVVGDIEQMLRRTLGEQVELVTSLAAGLEPVLADRGQLELVLVNLAVNARDAMPAGGYLTIDTENVDVDDELAGQRPNLCPGRYVRLRVSDTGSGIPADVLGHVFEPFYSTKPKGAGTGLGLATVYGIVVQAQGDVHIYSTPDIGTTVSVLLPVTEEDHAPHPHPAPVTWTSGGETVLVVDDEPALREVTCRILSRNGYQVLSAGSGAEALALVREYDGDIDLLVTDVIMPQMFGKEVAEAVVTLRPATRVLYMSGYAQPVLSSQGTLDAGVVLVEKPFSESALLQKVHEVLDQQA